MHFVVVALATDSIAVLPSKYDLHNRTTLPGTFIAISIASNHALSKAPEMSSDISTPTDFFCRTSRMKFLATVTADKIDFPEVKSN